MALRRLAGKRDLIAANLIRSLSVSPSFSRPIHNNHSHPNHSSHPHTQIPLIPRPSFSSVFDPLGASTRSSTQGELMNQQMEKYNPFLSAPGILGIGGARVRAWNARDALHLTMYKIDGIKAEMKRSFSSSANSSEEQLETDVKIQPNANITRPLSPHLPVYKPQTNSLASIFHRISGVYLTGSFIAFYLLTMKLGLICFTYYPFYLLMFYSSKLALISAELAVLALAYNVFHTFPHLFADFKALLFLGRPGRK